MEFALILPLLLLFIFGIIDFGRMVNYKIGLNEAAREGARAAALAGTAEAQDRIDIVTDGMGGPGPAASITGCPSNPGPDDNATVTLTYEFHYVTPLAIMAELGNTTLRATGVMPCLQ